MTMFAMGYVLCLCAAIDYVWRMIVHSFFVHSFG
nr:hypothetical protein Q903MT_gene6245 [Picea sitchensis]